MTGPREIGIAHAEAFTAYWSLFDPRATHGIMATPSTPHLDSPDAIDQTVRDFRSWHDTKPVFVVVSGALEFMRNYRQGLTLPDCVVYCGDEVVLSELGIREILDRNWHAGDPYLSVPDLISSTTHANDPDTPTC